jgi:hypothetical protein
MEERETKWMTVDCPGPDSKQIEKMKMVKTKIEPGKVWAIEW